METCKLLHTLHRGLMYLYLLDTIIIITIYFNMKLMRALNNGEQRNTTATHRTRNEQCMCKASLKTIYLEKVIGNCVPAKSPTH